ncbi:hypothetical protein VARIO8X_100248 [Burkholderiales bacterium 8X]|nr:hypothetical protein VARIO8X_100248 [Burkholderiales bacterium 8X]
MGQVDSNLDSFISRQYIRCGQRLFRIVRQFRVNWISDGRNSIIRPMAPLVLPSKNGRFVLAISAASVVASSPTLRQLALDLLVIQADFPRPMLCRY